MVMDWMTSSFSAPRSDRHLSDAGAVYLFLAASIQNLVVVPTNQADYIFEGSQVNAQLGYDILGNVNIDNDGVGDLVLSILPQINGVNPLHKAMLFVWEDSQREPMMSVMSVR